MDCKIGSLFDGSGGFPLAGTLCGVSPAWASEVEPYPIAVTRERFPTMKHLGDISKINGAEVEPVDIITFGSPCQDLSVAGKRAGLKHEANGDEETTRSGLFMEAVRIIKEMRAATNGKYPRFALWENVPGAFSSNKGEDFRIVLEELIKINEPSAVMPPVPQRGWSYADSYVGDGWSLAYRTFDAQYWGVPQRRRRIHLVVDFTGSSAREVLFEREGVRGYFKEGRTPWQRTPADTSAGSGADNRAGEVGGGRQLAAVVYSFDSLASNSMKSKNPHSGCREVQVARTLDTTDPNPSKNQGGLAVVQPVTYDARGNGDGQTVNTLTGDHNNRVTDYTSVVVESTGTEPVYCLQGNGIDRADTAGCNGKGWREDASYTLNTIDRPAIVYRQGGFAGYVEGEVRTLRASGGGAENLIAQTSQQYIVRRLTPTECARLQGFADCWGVVGKKTDLTDEEYRFWLDVRNTHAVINGRAVKDYSKAQILTWYNKLYTDSAEYRMWGNGIALPPALYCMQGIVDALEAGDEDTLPPF